MKTSYGPPARIVATGIFIIALVLSLAGVAFAQNATNITTDDLLCRQCHLNPDKTEAHGTDEAKHSKCLKCHAPHAIGFKTGLYVPPKEKCVICHIEHNPKHVKEAAAGSKISLHNPFEQANCIDCHQEHDLGQPSRLTIDSNKLCLTCHRTVDKPNKVKHPPYAEGRCTDCHNPHYSVNEHLLHAPQDQLCSTCHRVTAEKMPVQHLPFAKGQCTSCHNPHAADFAKLLNIAPNKLCYSCHRLEEMQKQYKHPPVVEGACTKCHSPHQSEGKKLLPVPMQKVCYQCHPAIGRDFEKASHHPVGVLVECSGCHAPHAADNLKLLYAVGNQLCVRCHEDKFKSYDRIEHSRMDRGKGPGACTNCHLPHGADYWPLLPKESVALCSGCHPSMTGSPFTHPVGARYQDPNRGGTLTCTSTCHDPHGSENNYSLRLPNRGICLVCHKDL